MLEVDKREAALLRSAIHTWQQEKLITEEQATAMHQRVTVRSTDWQTISFYIFIAAISCALMAFGSLVLDEKWIEVIRKKLSLTDGIIAIIFAGISTLLCYQGWRRSRHQALYSLNRELFWLLPVLSIGVSVVYLGKSVAYLNGNYGAFWLLAGGIYAALGIRLHSRLLWVSMLLCLIPAYVKLTYYLTQNGPWFLGMNLPCRMALLALLLIAAAAIMRRTRVYTPVKEITWSGGWLLFMIAGWLISIFGNCGTWQEWQDLRQVHLLLWVVIFTAQCAATLLLGLRLKDNLLRDLGVIFLLLDLYTRYFEYLWDHTNKGLFFGILALSFWWTGKWLEKRLKRKAEAPR
ncbi:hypothetical protein [Chitinophaga nivalis]|uniref:DUF2157 domain-containing protein n=1 Tax=Chitinophaga nivalis TaxID=2991709 RepID=A0ABT3INT9_9BACT|nr:hypothetical protein [Chitinophaga nivalis]MCW3464679.1 hypothetical protein [Chitinophaga nivalis]MCW3485630.1 hypothetical protein [Chitinophaga nivalis]